VTTPNITNEFSDLSYRTHRYAVLKNTVVIGDVGELMGGNAKEFIIKEARCR
jgi:hypothetical protein